MPENTQLWDAVKQDDLEVVRSLLKETGLSLDDQKDKVAREHTGLLWLAISNRHLRIVQYFLEDLDLSLRAIFGHDHGMWLQKAVTGGDLQLFQYIQKKINLTDQELKDFLQIGPYKLIHKAIENGHLELVKHFLNIITAPPEAMPKVSDYHAFINTAIDNYTQEVLDYLLHQTGLNDAQKKQVINSKNYTDAINHCRDNADDKLNKFHNYLVAYRQSIQQKNAAAEVGGMVGIFGRVGEPTAVHTRAREHSSRTAADSTGPTQ